MVAKIIAWGRDRPEALARLRVALRDTTVVIAAARRPSRSCSSCSTARRSSPAPPTPAGWTATGAGGSADPRAARRARARAGGDRRLRGRGGAGTGRVPALRPRRPAPRQPRRRPRVELGYRGQTYKLNVAQISPHRYRVELDDRRVDVEVDRLSAFESRLTHRRRAHHGRRVARGPSHLVEVDGVSHRVSRDEGGVVRAPAPAVVVAVRAARRRRRRGRADVVVLESMKMETPVRAPARAGSARSWPG